MEGHHASVKWTAQLSMSSAVRSGGIWSARWPVSTEAMSASELAVPAWDSSRSCLQAELKHSARVRHCPEVKISHWR